MEIRENLKEILRGEKVFLTKLTIEEEKCFPNSLLNNVLIVGDQERVKCFWCNKSNTSWCWNCESPHCNNHSRAILIREGLINTLCLDCSEEFEKKGVELM